MDRQYARQLISLLEHVRRRPGMFFPLDQSGLKGFLGGLHAFQKTFLGATDDPTLTAAILRERGWDADSAVAPWPDIDARGFDIHAIIAEVLTIEIEVLRRIHGIQ
jgi:hypothetical protein